MPDPVGDLARAAVAAAVEPQPDLLGELVGLPDTPRVQAAAARRAGRPAGSRNRRSEDVARFVVEQLGDPLLHQAAVAVMRIDELVAAGLSVEQAFAERRLAAQTVLPYLHRRMPVQVDVSTHKMVTLTIVDAPAALPEAANDEIVQVVDYQEVGDAADPAV